MDSADRSTGGCGLAGIFHRTVVFVAGICADEGGCGCPWTVRGNHCWAGLVGGGKWRTSLLFGTGGKWVCMGGRSGASGTRHKAQGTKGLEHRPRVPQAGLECPPVWVFVFGYYKVPSRPIVAHTGTWNDSGDDAQCSVSG